jgi:uncharacterized sulfatase
MHKFYHLIFFGVSLLTIISCESPGLTENKQKATGQEPQKPPNILFAISDDQSFPHASAYGAHWINTPAFDRVAREGVLFTNAFSASPGCSPSRAALLTGRNTWQIENAGTHASSFPIQYMVYPDLLEEAGYFVGYTQKGWGPGNWKISGRTRNPAGEAFNGHKMEAPTSGISSNDYAANFSDFLENRPEGKPFCFWYGASEPHRVFEKGSGLKAGKKLEEVKVPPFLPDSDEVRSDLLDYAVEIEWFDQHLGQMLQLLEEAGELDNTIIVVTSDNGMAFPRAKANLYEFGNHVPLAIRWGDKVPGNRRVEDVVNLIDLFPTYLEAIGLKHPSEKYPLEGKSLMNILLSDQEGKVDPERKGTYAARERHSSSRWNNHTYPQRSLRTDQYLYIRNFKPERWPAGAPQKYEEDGTLGEMHQAYHDIDACPTQDFLVNHRNDPEIGIYFHLAVDKRPEEEFFDILKDPGCLNNLANDPAFREELLAHRNQLGGYLMETDDPRVTGKGDIYESYIRYSPLRQFPIPDWAREEASLKSLK